MDSDFIKVTNSYMPHGLELLKVTGPMEKLQATGRGAGGKDERLLELPIKVFKDLM